MNDKKYFTRRKYYVPMDEQCRYYGNMRFSNEQSEDDDEDTIE